MNGMFNTQFITGFLVSDGLPQQTRLLTGLAAGQMKGDALIGPLLLKPLVDQATASEKARQDAAAEANGLRPPLEIDLPAEVTTIALKVPNAPGATFAAANGASPGASVDASGTVTFGDDGSEETIAIAINVGGVVRQVTLVRAADSGMVGNSGGTGSSGSTASVPPVTGSATAPRTARRAEGYTPPESGTKTTTTT